MQVNTRYINSTKGTSSAQTQSRFDAKEKYWQGSGRSEQAAGLHSFHRLFVPGALIPVCCAQTTVVSQIWFMLVTVVLHKHFWMTANTFSEQKEPWSCDNASLLCTDKTVVCQIRYAMVTVGVGLHKHFGKTVNTFSEQIEPWSCETDATWRWALATIH